MSICGASEGRALFQRACTWSLTWGFYPICRTHGGMCTSWNFRFWVKGFLMPCNFANQSMGQISISRRVKEELDISGLGSNGF